MAKENVPTKARSLNMDEKRKIEKVLLDDIDTTKAFYTERRAQEKTALSEKAIANPPREARTALRHHQKTSENLKRAGSQLRAMGYDTDYHGHLRINWPDAPKLIKDFDAETTKHEKQLTNLKRTYTVKLFAGGEEAKDLLAALARELALIVKQN